jgi:hypothetical protein
MGDDGPSTAVPTSDVLPSRVRRRLGARDGVLAGVLVLEFLVGVGAGVAWEAREDLGRWWLPDSVVAVDSGPGAAAAVSVTSAVTSSVWVTVPPPPSPPVPPPPPPRTEPRSPFEVQAR